MNLQRCRALNQKQYSSGPIVYWMSRDQRVHDNWALLLAAEHAQHHQVPLLVLFCLVPTFLGATERQYDFMLQGLAEVERTLRQLGIHFQLLIGDPIQELKSYTEKNQVGEIITDFSPLQLGRNWREKLAAQIDVPVLEVDAHNIVPAWVASVKQEVGARTLRSKINKLLAIFLESFPTLVNQSISFNADSVTTDWKMIRSKLKVDTTVKPISWLKPGETAAEKALSTFIEQGLATYHLDRNDPTKNGQSNISPYLHFGQLSAQRVALDISRAKVPSVAKESFLEEIIIRRELADNFCLYNPNYDTPASFSNWASTSLASHHNDKREFIYTLKQFESAETHDSLWNSAQLEMVKKGKMHGYLRMYWAKKILEWTPDPETAMKYAIYLNDRYQLDGRDPNGYAGIAWSIGGVHDRPWFDRPVYGTIRYMNFNGAARKFSIPAYIAYVDQLTSE